MSQVDIDALEALRAAAISDMQYYGDGMYYYRDFDFAVQTQFPAIASEMKRLREELAAARAKHYEECAVICDADLSAVAWQCAQKIRVALADGKTSR